jgi:hypothetical protein
MRRRSIIWTGAALLLASGALWAQREFRVYDNLEGSESASELPDDYKVPGEFVVGRLMYPGGGGNRFFGGGDWRQGGTSWTVDYPRGDRIFAKLMRRLTTVNVRSVEQPVNLDDGDDVYNWPFLIVGLPGSWNLTDEQAAKLRDYLLRGGFMLADSFFGTDEWSGFEESLRRVFPDRPVVELPDDHPIFHVLYDLNQKKQISNMRSLRGRNLPYRADGADPHWRAVLDDDGRVMVAITFNNDLGDSWQWADVPEYPQVDSNLGIRLGINYALYALTH